MNNPRTLVLSIAATACGFILALAAVIGQASHAATPLVEVAMTPAIVSSVAQEISQVESVTWTVAWEPAASQAGSR
jgi:hypothetical protein